ncbi:hypothetical protein E6P97_04050 [Patescibacteria group bacterium]|nr:MAG: hypothetical protein E6P97_04050 [Patescibacteria group bacterium]
MALTPTSAYVEEALTLRNSSRIVETLQELLGGASATVIMHSPSHDDSTPRVNAMNNVRLGTVRVTPTNRVRATLTIEGDKTDINAPFGEGMTGSSDETPPKTGVFTNGDLVCLTYETKLGRHYITVIP